MVGRTLKQRTLKIGTRGSQLALAQARLVQRGMQGPGEIVVLRTSGDRFQDVPLDQAGGVGLFTKEIERALLDGRIDLAVHSLKDLPVQLPAGLVLGAVLRREAPSDLLLVREEALAPELPLPIAPGSSVGTSATRRRALLATLREDLRPVPMRGNVPTRIRKALEGECDALLLAQAGVARLGLDPAPLRAFSLNPQIWPCAPGQAAIAVELRADDEETAARLVPLDHPPSRACVQAERSLLQASGGGCHSAFAAWASQHEQGAALQLAMLASDGQFRLARAEAGSLEEAQTQALHWIATGAPSAWSPPEGMWICRPFPSSS